jgi:hypothetical protein
MLAAAPISSPLLLTVAGELFSKRMMKKSRFGLRRCVDTLRDQK